MKERKTNGEYCAVCNKPLTGRQTKYCSNSCKCKVTNYTYQNYRKQHERGLRRKRMLVSYFGGKCSKCEYAKNYAALVFHHRDPKEKKFNLTIRRLSNTNRKDLEKEALKCDLLCSNCHMELHYPDMAIL